MKVEMNPVVKWLTLLAVIGLSIATLYALESADKFEVVEEQLLTDSQFSDASSHWEYADPSIVSFEDGNLIFQSDDITSSKVVQRVSGVDLDAPAFVRLTFEASSENISAQDRAGAGGGVLLLSRDGQGELLSGHRLLLLDGSHKSDSYSQTEIIEEQPESIEIIFRLDHAAGKFSIGNPVLSVLLENRDFKLMKAVFLCVWIVVALLLLKVLVTVLSTRQFVALFLLLGVALTGVLLPEPIMHGITQKIASAVPEPIRNGGLEKLALVYPSGRLSDSGALVSKVGHFLVFFAIGLFAGLSRRKFGFYYVFACVIVFALITEVGQMFVFGRTTSVADFALDCGAGILGMLLGSALTLIVLGTKGRVDSPAQF